jgi:hypothetical protein
VTAESDAKLARWAQRDAAIGLAAELTEVRVTVSARETEVADLRERNERLAQRVAQLVTERDGLARRLAKLERTPLSRRVYRRARLVAQRALPGRGH